MAGEGGQEKMKEQVADIPEIIVESLDVGSSDTRVKCVVLLFDPCHEFLE